MVRKYLTSFCKAGFFNKSIFDFNYQMTYPN
jgi:hypothetical protein